LRLGGPLSQLGHGGEEKNSQLLPGLEPPVIQPIAQGYITELSWLYRKMSKIKLIGINNSCF
jgi:hypothetical protein